MSDNCENAKIKCSRNNKPVSKMPQSELSGPFLSGSVSSDTECTGLMPTPPASDDELEAWEELYPFSPAQVVSRE